MTDESTLEVGGGAVELSAEAPRLAWDTDMAVGVVALSGLALLIAFRKWFPTP